jgi:hypothetical protein
MCGVGHAAGQHIHVVRRQVVGLHMPHIGRHCGGVDTGMRVCVGGGGDQGVKTSAAAGKICAQMQCMWGRA